MGITFQGNLTTNLTPDCPLSCTCSGEASIDPSTTSMERRLRLQPTDACVAEIGNHPNIDISALRAAIKDPSQVILLFTRYQLFGSVVAVQYNYNVGLTDLTSGSYQMTPTR